MDEFSRWKAAALAKADLSKKGSIDSAIENLVNYINQQPEYFTTSSCSGRILLCSDNDIYKGNERVNVNQPQQNNKKGCVWYFVSHSIVNSHEIIETFSDVPGPSKLKFEPFVLHVQCCTLEAARLLNMSAVASGFRNSGISIGKNGKKFISAVRGTACLEVPLTNMQGNRLASDEYVDYIVKIANKKLDRNFLMIHNFYEEFKQSKSTAEICENSGGSGSNMKSEVYRRKGKFARANYALVNKDSEEDIDMDSIFLFEDG